MSKSKSKVLPVIPDEKNPPEVTELLFARYAAFDDAAGAVVAKTKALKESFETDFAKDKRIAKEDANWKEIPDVDYTDLEHFIENCRRKKDVESFNTAIRILEVIKKQVVGK